MQDKERYEQAQESMALLRMLVLGMNQVEEGKGELAAHVVGRLRDRSQSISRC